MLSCWYFYFLYFDTYSVILTKELWNKHSKRLLAKPKVRAWWENTYCHENPVRVLTSRSCVDISLAHVLWLPTSSQVSNPHRNYLGSLLPCLLGIQSCVLLLIFASTLVLLCGYSICCLELLQRTNSVCEATVMKLSTHVKKQFKIFLEYTDPPPFFL